MRTKIGLLALLVAFGLAAPLQGAGVDIGVIKKLAAKFPFAIVVGDVKGENARFLYADRQAHIHVHSIKSGKLELAWENTNLGSRVTSMFVADLYGDGGLKLVVGTTAGRILIYDMDGYDLVWENLQDPFGRIDYMVSANLDDDAQHELVFIADRHLHIYDSLKKTIEWKSSDEFQAHQILVGEVDDDPQPEIILNTGTIMDSRFYSIEFQADKTFGDRISLLDVNNDGIPEIIGEFLDYNLQVFDVYAEREIW